MHYELTLHKRPSIISIRVGVQFKQRISIIGYDPDPKHPNTIYFARSIEVSGVGMPIDIPMPVAPDKLILEITQEHGFYGSQIQADIKVKDMPSLTVAFPPRILEYYNFLKTFAQKAGYIEPGFYVSKDENYIIWAKPHLDGDATPARVNRRTGVMKFNLEKIRGYTVFMRIFIGLHEYFHYEKQTTNEVEADMGALKVFLAAGYPKSEANYSMTKIFDNSEEAIRRVSILNNYIKNYDKQSGFKPVRH